MTFGLAAFHVVTPIASQREKAEHIAALWLGEGEHGEHRARALQLVRTAASLDDVIASYGDAAVVVGTSANPSSFPGVPRTNPRSAVRGARDRRPSPMLLVLGTGWGLADSLIPSVSRVLAPIDGAIDVESPIGSLGRRDSARPTLRSCALTTGWHSLVEPSSHRSFRPQLWTPS